MKLDVFNISRSVEAQDKEQPLNTTFISWIRQRMYGCPFWAVYLLCYTTGLYGSIPGIAPCPAHADYCRSGSRQNKPYIGRLIALGHVHGYGWITYQPESSVGTWRGGGVYY